MKHLYKKITTVLGLLLVCSNLSAQQTCSTASSITPTSTCNYSTHTTTGTEYWLKFVASSPTVNISLVTVKFGINATHIHNLALYSGNCSSPVLVTDDELPFVADAFIAKFDNTDSLIWNTYFGGNQAEKFTSINIDANNNVFVSGETFSPDFPTFNPFGGAFFDGTLGGSQDQNLLKFSPTGQLLWSTYIGGSNSEFTFFSTSDNRIDFDSFNNIYLVGFTKSTDFPVFQSTGFYDDTASTSNGYIMKFSTSNLSRLWSSYINGTGEITLSSIAVDKVNNNVYVAGTTSSDSIPLFQQTNIYFQDTLLGQFSTFEKDACLFGFNNNNNLILGTYFGGYQIASEGEFIMDMSITNQKLYFTGLTSAQSQPAQTPFPLFDSGAPAYYDDVYNGGQKDAFVSEICVDLITAVQDNKNKPLKLVTIYPNPSYNSITVVFSDKGDKQITIYNIEGKLIATYFSDKNKMEISLQNIAKGSYIIKVISEATVQTAKFIKQ